METVLERESVTTVFSKQERCENVIYMFLYTVYSNAELLSYNMNYNTERRVSVSV